MGQPHSWWGKTVGEKNLLIIRLYLYIQKSSAKIGQILTLLSERSWKQNGNGKTYLKVHKNCSWGHASLNTAFKYSFMFSKFQSFQKVQNSSTIKHEQISRFFDWKISPRNTNIPNTVKTIKSLELTKWGIKVFQRISSILQLKSLVSLTSTFISLFHQNWLEMQARIENNLRLEEKMHIEEKWLTMYRRSKEQKIA